MKRVRKFRILSGRPLLCNYCIFLKSLFIQIYSCFDVYRKSIKFEEREDHVAWSDQEPDVSESKDGEKAVEDASVSRDEGHEEEDPLMQVMLKSIQDPELAPIYQNLPELG
jgi:hypothetical protein